MTQPQANEYVHQSVRVALGDRSYDILIGTGLVTRLGSLIEPVLSRPYTVIVTDENVARHWLDVAVASLSDAGIAHDTVILPAGEATKCFATYERLSDQLLALGVERSDHITALGGGVIGDLTGFAAATLRRGVGFIQVPTSLLAQVDSSVGGKTGINTAHGKNLVGAFHQPSLVVADLSTLESLPEREMRAGYAEVVKYGLIDDPAFFTWLEASGNKLLSGDTSARTHAVATSCRAKARIVAEDEFETGKRALLNLGHTFAHAFEAEGGYDGTLLHGEAVALGMLLAFRLSAVMGLCAPEVTDRVSAHLAAAGLPVCIPDIGLHLDTDTLISHMQQDKKTEAGNLVFVLAHDIGGAEVRRDVSLDQLHALLDHALQE